MANFQISTEARRGQEPYRLGDIVLAYVASLEFAISGYILLGVGGVVLHLLIGILLVWFVGRRVIWHTFQASLRDIVRVKVLMWITWPISVPVLAVQIFIAERL